VADQNSGDADILDELRVAPPWNDDDGSTELASALKAALPKVDPLELVRLRRDLLAEIGKDVDEGEDDGDVERDIAIGSSMAERLADLLLLGATALARETVPMDIALQIEGGAMQGVVSDESDPRPFRLFIHDHDLEASDRDENEHATIEFEDGKTSVAQLDVQVRGPFTQTPADGPMWTSLRSEADRLLDLD